MQVSTLGHGAESQRCRGLEHEQLRDKFGTDLDRDRVPMDIEHFIKILEWDWASQRASSSSPFPNLGSVVPKSESLTRSPG